MFLKLVLVILISATYVAPITFNPTVVKQRVDGALNRVVRSLSTVLTINGLVVAKLSNGTNEVITTIDAVAGTVLQRLFDGVESIPERVVSVVGFFTPKYFSKRNLQTYNEYVAECRRFTNKDAVVALANKQSGCLDAQISNVLDDVLAISTGFQKVVVISQNTLLQVVKRDRGVTFPDFVGLQFVALRRIVWDLVQPVKTVVLALPAIGVCSGRILAVAVVETGSQVYNFLKCSGTPYLAKKWV